MDEEEPIDRSDPFNFHKCKSCSFRTRSLRTILSHVQKHKVKSENYRFSCKIADLEHFECQFCYFETDLKLALDRHTLLVHGPIVCFDPEIELKGYVCDKCDFETFSILVFARHVCSEEDDINNLNEECEKSEENTCAGDEDIGRPKKKGLKCWMCPSASFKSKPSLYNHVRILHRKKQMFECEHCSYKTTYSHNLDRHLKARHLQDERFDCYHCSFTTFFKPYLVQHMKKHQTRRFRCSYCSYENVHRHIIKYHIANVHESTGFQCEECLKRYKNKGSLLSHRRRKHQKELKLFSCQKCSFQTIYKANYEQHTEIVHRNTKEFQWLQCEQCSFKTTTLRYLKNHMNVKHAEKKKIYVCEICSKTFMENRSFKGHRKLEHGIGNNVEVFQCEKCSYKTYLKSSFSTHVMLKHTKPEEKPYLYCDKCSFKTCFKHDLKRHVDVVHGTKSSEFKCDKCEFKCGFRHYLLAHIRRMHK